MACVKKFKNAFGGVRTIGLCLKVQKRIKKFKNVFGDFVAIDLGSKV